jgi:sodium-dependent dicarboxylate transporter 2/3/5
MSNTATAAILIPLAVQLMPEHMVLLATSIALSASCALLLPVSTPPNAIAFSTGFLKQRDFRGSGLLIGLGGPLVINLWLLLLL